MPTTDELVRQLSAEVAPHPPGAAPRRLAIGLALGALASAVAIFVLMGPPLQHVPHTGAAAFAMKLLYSAALLALCFMLLLASGRPGMEVGRRWLWLLVPPALLAIGAAAELSMALPQQRQAIWLGSMWWMCALEVVLLAIPVFAGTVWAFRRLAPTRLRYAGLLAGLTAGSAGATIYAFFCMEGTATFLLSWFSLGILVAGLIGLMMGPRLLKW
jgi:hypothetical protein